MTLLLDTHAFVWWVQDNPKLSAAARNAISDDNSLVAISIASAWEIAIKVGLGRWHDARQLIEEIERVVPAEGFDILPIKLEHVRAAGLVTFLHRDPFDRLLAAQASIEGLTLVSSDPKVVGLGAPVLW